MINQDNSPLKSSRYLAFVIGILGGAVLAIFWPVLKDAEVRQEVFRRIKMSWSRALKS